MTRTSKLGLLLGALLAAGCGHWQRVVVETRVVVLTPVPVSVSSKIDLTQAEKSYAPQRQGEDRPADRAPQPEGEEPAGG